MKLIHVPVISCQFIRLMNFNDNLYLSCIDRWTVTMNMYVCFSWLYVSYFDRWRWTVTMNMYVCFSWLYVSCFDRWRWTVTMNMYVCFSWLYVSCFDRWRWTVTMMMKMMGDLAWILAHKCEILLCSPSQYGFIKILEYQHLVLKGSL